MVLAPYLCRKKAVTSNCSPNKIQNGHQHSNFVHIRKPDRLGGRKFVSDSGEHHQS